VRGEESANGRFDQSDADLYNNRALKSRVGHRGASSRVPVVVSHWHTAPLTKSPTLEHRQPPGNRCPNRTSSAASKTAYARALLHALVADGGRARSDPIERGNGIDLLGSGIVLR
jgi:hypothetical protein